MAVVSILHHAEFGSNDHREDATHFETKYPDIYKSSSFFSEKTSDFDVYEDDTIAACKQKAAEQFSIIGSQRWFCRGGILSDIMTVKQCKIPDNFVIQIIVQQVTAETKHL